MTLFNQQYIKSMNYDEFLTAIQETEIKLLSGKVFTEYHSEAKWLLDKDWEKEKEAFFIASSTELGGVSGGSCWDDSNPRPYTSSGIHQNLNIDPILEKFCPNISYLAAKSLYLSVVKDTEYTEREYYGNHTNYRIEYCMALDLFNEMKKKELL